MISGQKRRPIIHGSPPLPYELSLSPKSFWAAFASTKIESIECAYTRKNGVSITLGFQADMDSWDKRNIAAKVHNDVFAGVAPFFISRDGAAHKKCQHNTLIEANPDSLVIHLADRVDDKTLYGMMRELVFYVAQAGFIPVQVYNCLRLDLTGFFVGMRGLEAVPMANLENRRKGRKGAIKPGLSP
ncbi:MAG: hypothetical protein PHY92_05915 [Alphaproteobacteria bacterium]|nr:hypothetical protein [Alphaproteobacteria bacterium]